LLCLLLISIVSHILSQPIQPAVQPSASDFRPTTTFQQLQCPVLSTEPAVLQTGTNWKIEVEFKRLPSAFSFTSSPSSPVSSNLGFDSTLDGLSIDRVDVHWRIQRSGIADVTSVSNNEMSERMTRLSVTRFGRDSLALPIQLNSGDCLRYWFTYFVQVAATPQIRTSCETDHFMSCPVPPDHLQSTRTSLFAIQQKSLQGQVQQAILPLNQFQQPPLCSVVHYEDNLIPLGRMNTNQFTFQFRVLSDLGVEYVDVHWTSDHPGKIGESSMNERMVRLTDHQFERNAMNLPKIVLAIDDCIHYRFTYHIKSNEVTHGQIGCDTPTFAKCIQAQQPVETSPKQGVDTPFKLQPQPMLRI